LLACLYFSAFFDRFQTRGRETLLRYVHSLRLEARCE
jgi:hypothetical protein